MPRYYDYAQCSNDPKEVCRGELLRSKIVPSNKPPNVLIITLI